MSKNKDASLRSAIANGEPLTHFFFEYQGDRSVDPETLIDSGITLWHENVFGNDVHDNSSLWRLAAALLDRRQETPMYSWVEWLRYQITLGILVPEGWDRSKPFPYKGLLVSAIYFQEAQRICEAGDPSRAWHIVALAYYHLGLNTMGSTVKNTSRAAQMMHAQRSEGIRALVLAASNRIATEGTATSIAQAKKQVLDLIEAKQDVAWVRDCLNEFDARVSVNTKGRNTGSTKNNVHLRIANLLETWSLPSGPYPEIAESFSRFNARKRKGGTTATTFPASELVSIEESDCFLRLVNIFNDDHVLTMKVSRSETE